MNQELTQKRCVPCEGGTAKLTPAEIAALLPKLNDWQVHEQTRISKKFPFKNYYHTIAFVNAIAWLAHHENHHPDLEVSYNYCIVNYNTHAIGGLSENDFICAAKVDVAYSEYKK